MIDNKYILGLYPCFCHRAPKILGVSQEITVTKIVFCYVNEMSLGKHLRMGAGCQENQTLH